MLEIIWKHTPPAGVEDKVREELAKTMDNPENMHFATVDIDRDYQVVCVNNGSTISCEYMLKAEEGYVVYDETFEPRCGILDAMLEQMGMEEVKISSAALNALMQAEEGDETQIVQGTSERPH